ncbi:MAG: 50S ribosomal protein L33 [Alphaproteobacteria bacterium]
MAKTSTVLIKLVSTAGTGTFYVKKKNPRKTTEKLKFKKFDRKAGVDGRGAHVEFVEQKMK